MQNKKKTWHTVLYTTIRNSVGIEACSWLGDGTVHTDVNVMPFHLRKQCCYHDFFSPSSPATYINVIHNLLKEKPQHLLVGSSWQCLMLVMRFLVIELQQNVRPQVFTLLFLFISVPLHDNTHPMPPAYICCFRSSQTYVETK